MIRLLRFRLRLVLLTEAPVAIRAFLQRLPQLQKRRMPVRESILGELIVATIIREIVEESRLDPSCPRIPVNVAQRIQRPPLITEMKSRTVIALLPKVTTPTQHPIEAHGRIPVQPMHDLGQILWLLWVDQVMDVVRHDT